MSNIYIYILDKLIKYSIWEHWIENCLKDNIFMDLIQYLPSNSMYVNILKVEGWRYDVDYHIPSDYVSLFEEDV